MSSGSSGGQQQQGMGFAASLHVEPHGSRVQVPFETRIGNGLPMQSNTATVLFTQMSRIFSLVCVASYFFPKCNCWMNLTKCSSCCCRTISRKYLFILNCQNKVIHSMLFFKHRHNTPAHNYINTVPTIPSLHLKNFELIIIKLFWALD